MISKTRRILNCNRRVTSVRPLLLIALLASAFQCNTAIAQTISLSPEQQRLIDQLPASQRDAAMRQLRQYSEQAAKQRLSTDPAGSGATESQGEPTTPANMVFDQTPRIAPEDTVVVSVVQPETTSLSTENPAEIELRATLIRNVRNRNPYKLDELGRLVLPGIAAIDLAGLTEIQATLRLQSDPALSGIEATVSLLPLSDVGVKSLLPFGYDLFSSDRQVSADNRTNPVSADYVIGPGDVVRIQLFGNRNAEYELVVERDGTVLVPDIGPVIVSGLSFAQMRENITQRVGQQLLGTKVGVTLGELRSVQVFLVGEVNNPGAYTVGSMANITTVLAAGGGVATNGSLRKVELKRNGTSIAQLDVYDLLLRGDTRDDARIQSGDVVFVPPVGTRVTVSGEVRRPAIYEYIGAANVAEIIDLAGGLQPRADRTGIRINRIDKPAGHLTINVDFTQANQRSLKISDGDLLNVPEIVPGVDRTVSVVGNVYRPGPHEWRSGLRLSDVIKDSRSVKPGSDLNYLLIRREPVANIGPTVLSANLQSAWALPGSPVDLKLQPRDTIYVFDLQVGRSYIVDPILSEMQLRASRDAPEPIVNVGGSVNAPGSFPLEPGMRIADLIRAGGGLSQSAYGAEAELTRYIIDSNGERDTIVTSIDLSAALRGDPSQNIELSSFDYLNIREVPSWRDQEFVTLVGEVRFPGRYPIKKDESLTSIIQRAGGLTDLAYPGGSIFTREVLKEREKEQLLTLASRVERDLASLSLSDSGQSEAISTGQALLSQLRSTEPTGRLVIDLTKALSSSPLSDITVRDGDVLRVPRQPQEVTVIGEVQYATSHLFVEGSDRSDYIQRSGGTTSKADLKRIYVVRASGEVLAGNRSRFFSRNDSVKIRAGDTIVVPLDTDRIRPLTLWTSVSQVIYNLAIAATAVSRF